MSLRQGMLSERKSSEKPNTQVKQEKQKKRPKSQRGLRGINELPPEEAFAIRSKGGINSGIARREQASLKKCIAALLDMQVLDRETIEKMAELGIDARELTYRMLVSVGLIRKAAEGNVNALHEIREIMGEIDRLEDGEGDINIMITRAKRRKQQDEEDDE